MIPPRPQLLSRRNLGLLTCLIVLCVVSESRSQPTLESAQPNLEEIIELNEEALRHADSGEYRLAFQRGEKAVALAESVLADDDPELATLLTNVAEFAYDAGDVQSSTRLHQRAASIVEKSLGSSDVALGRILTGLGQGYRVSGELWLADEAYGRAFEILTQAHGPYHPDLAILLGHQAILAEKMGDYSSARQLYELSSTMHERLLGPDNPVVATSLANFAAHLTKQGDLDDAETMLQRALNIQEASLDPRHPDVGTTLRYLAELSSEQGESLRAKTFFERALLIQEPAFGREHPSVSLTLNGLSITLADLGDFMSAQTASRRALEISEKTRGKEHSETATIMGNLAGILQETGDYAEAEELLRSALAATAAVFGDNHPNVAIPLNNLGVLFSTKGDFAKAEVAYLRALNLLVDARGREHPTVGTTLANLGGVYLSTGDYEQAEDALLEAFTIQRQLGDDHPDLAATGNDLGRVYARTGEWVKAEQLFSEVLRFQEAIYGPDHPDFARTLNNLGALYSDAVLSGETQLLSQALPLHQRALGVRERALGPDHESVADSLNNIAVLHSLSGNYDQARQLLNRALGIYQRVLGAEHRTTGQAMESLAITEWTDGNTQIALALIERAGNIAEHNLQHIAAFGSEGRKARYLSLIEQDIDLAVSFHTLGASSSPEAAALALTTIARRKGRTADVMSSSLQIVQEVATEQERTVLLDIIDTRSRLATVADQGSAQVDPNEFQRLASRLEQLELQLSTHTYDRVLAVQMLPIDLVAIRRGIPQDAALVEIIAYSPYHAPTHTWRPRRYAAYVLGRAGAITHVDLGEVHEVEQLVNTYRGFFDPTRLEDPTAASRQLHRQLAKPILEAAGKVSMLIVSPDEILSLLPFEALMDEQGQYLVERVAVHYLASSRDLLPSPMRKPESSAAVIVADPAFDAGRQSSPTESAVRPQSLDSLAITWERLPGTAHEASQIKRILPDARILTREDATETAIKELRSPRVLHIATHAFVDDFVETEAQTELGASPEQSTEWQLPEQVSMRRSGLVLAGPIIGRRVSTTES